MGERLWLSCETTADEQDVFFTWYKDGKELRSRPPRVRIMRQRVQFRRSHLEDSGNYTCRLETPDGLLWKSQRVVVEPEPRDSPPSELGWHEARALRLEAPEGLMIDEPDFVGSGPGERNKTLPESPPVFNRPEELRPSEVKPAGNVLKLKCPAVGNPQPNITWLRNGREPKRVYLNKWSLRLDDTVIQDSGNYTCVVCNYLACISHTFQVNIIGKPWVFDYKGIHFWIEIPTLNSFFVLQKVSKPVRF